jgi:ribosomal-protein-alanine N-acetyltransferase
MNLSNGNRNIDKYLKKDSVIIRPMKVLDLDDVLRIERESYVEPWLRDHFLYELQTSRISKTMVLEIEGKIAGYVGLWLLHPEIHVTNMTVSTVYRKQGLGTKLMDYVMNLALESKFKVITLEVRHNNDAALALYRKFGFEIRGIRKNYYAAEKADALIMSRTMR